MCRPMLLHSHTIPYTMHLSHTMLPEYKAVEWETEVHLNMAMKLQRRISDIYRSHFREQFSFSGLSPNWGVFHHTHKDRDICIQHCISLQQTVFVWFPRPHLQRGHFFPYMPLSTADCQDSSYLQNSSFFGATRLRSLLKGKGNASSCLEWGQLSRKWPKMRQTHSASLFTWE